MLEIIHMSKSYDGKKQACNDINLQIEEGDIYGFIGHNGAGKTTLLKSIVGILDFDQGDILINGISIKDRPLEAKKIMAYIPDNPDVYESLTGIQYLDFIADVYNVDLNERKLRISKYATQFEIFDVLSNPIASYSHGMKQKLVLIGALIHEPKILLLDEPFVGLDPKASYQVKEIFRDMCARGALIFFSTHVLEVVEKLCNKVAIIKNGVIVANGPTGEIIKDQSLEHIFLELIKEA
ncbi:MAG: ABC transporter ATP-binding protein [Candidatus Izemoplasmatales bacterium]|jgi:ABC-2 type transport system ATP-binding protein|nr:ABC transporter ATP-binding protein [Candidatus Izemoplasmatales bacterium]MDD5293778.1 ABC transporter ATP-binding protein [Candidatus Izemoplasmatales bacterium]